MEEIASHSLPVTLGNVYDVLDFRGWGRGGGGDSAGKSLLLRV